MVRLFWTSNSAFIRLAWKANEPKCFSSRFGQSHLNRFTFYAFKPFSDFAFNYDFAFNWVCYLLAFKQIRDIQNKGTHLFSF